jgi:hypothetical protein
VQSIHAGDGSTNKTAEKKAQCQTDFPLKLPAPFTNATGDGFSTASRQRFNRRFWRRNPENRQHLKAKGIGKTTRP